MLTFLYIFGIINILCIPVSLFIQAQNRDRLYVSDLIYAVVFGILYFFCTVSDWDKVIWKRGDK